MKRIPFTQTGYDKLLTEKGQLVASRPVAVEELKRAREMGDLSENGAYKGARFKLSDIDRRIRHLDHLIKHAHIVSSSQTDTVEIGCMVVVASEGSQQTFSIVGSFESNPSNGTISHKSPIGNALIGKKIGEQVTVSVPKGIVTYTIISITT
ncbi:MAG: transcription elongation factor GreA [Patescibacteria group bacterium]|nr:transcription elongation factor GreA [Patescibacteria group bacterium]MDE2589793.1 transcription elongation factor GreA [Patescibacteria group bacterium]